MPLVRVLQSRGTADEPTFVLDWIRAVMAARRQYADPRDPAILSAARQGIAESHDAGTGLVGDISNTLVTMPLLQEAGLTGHVFYELLGFNAPEPQERVAIARASIASSAWSTCSLNMTRGRRGWKHRRNSQSFFFKAFAIGRIGHIRPIGLIRALLQE